MNWKGTDMEWLTNEILFYGGIVAAVGSVVTAIIYFSISQIKKIRLNIQLDAEYGKIDIRRK